jgi:chloride channel protein, CIC family
VDSSPELFSSAYSNKQSRHLWKLRISEDRLFLGVAILIGILSGLAVVAFRTAIDHWHQLLLGSSPSVLRLFLAPTLTGLVIALLVMHVFPRVRGSGVNQTKAALYVFNGYIPLRTAVGKFITSSLAIGSGQSLGPEDPSLQIGASLASAIGRRVRLSRENVRLLAPVGAAAGLAAAFNAPISAVLFVIEEVIGRWSAGILGSVVLSAISSVVMVRWILGAQPTFQIPPLDVLRPQELLAYAVLGVIGGFAAVVFARAVGWLRPKMKRLARWTQYLQPAAAGFLIGCIAYSGAPEVMGAGYRYIEQAMHGQFTWKVLAVLALLKVAATTFSFVSGTPGGMFAPTLFVGAMLGGAVGTLEHVLFPHLAGSVGTYCLVGMGVLFAGFLRAPMTSVFMVLEIGADYSIILPVIIANTVAYGISRTLQSTPVFDLLSRQDGLNLPSLEEQREERILRVEDAMLPAPQLILDSGESASQAVKRTNSAEADFFLIRLTPSGWGSITQKQIARLVSDGKQELTLGSMCGDQLPVLYPDLPLEMALRHVHRAELIPVISRVDVHKLEGVISRDAILGKYQVIGTEEEPPA